MIQFNSRQQRLTRNLGPQLPPRTNHLHACVRVAGGAILLAALGSVSGGCRSHLLNTQLGTDFDRSIDAELVESSARRNESRAGSSVRPHPLTQRLRPGAAPSPTDRKQLATRRQPQRPDSDESTDYESKEKAEELLRNYAGGATEESDSKSIEAQRERIEGEIRRRQSRTSVGMSPVEREGAMAANDSEGDSGVSTGAASSAPAARHGEAMVFTLSDREKSMGIRRIDSQAEPQAPNIITDSTPVATRKGARVRFTDNSEAPSKTSSVEKLLGPVPEAQVESSVDRAIAVDVANGVAKENAVVASGNYEAVREQRPEPKMPTVGVEQRSEFETTSAMTLGPPGTQTEEPKELGPAELIEGLFAQLDQEYAAATNPQARINIEKKKRLLSMVADDINAATSPIDGLQPEAQEYIQKTLTALYDATDNAGHPSMTRRLTRALESHREAANNLARVASLRVASPAFCTEVDSFGVVKKFDSYTFQQDQEVLLYCELENFASKKLGGGFETRLQGSYEIVNADGDTVLEQVLPEDSDVCANQRRDFYIAYRLFMPVRIEPGAYQLKLYIEDIHGKKFGQAEIDFRITNAK